jgi:hypothetical protein
VVCVNRNNQVNRRILGNTLVAVNFRKKINLVWVSGDAEEIEVGRASNAIGRGDLAGVGYTTNFERIAKDELALLRIIALYGTNPGYGLRAEPVGACWG